MHMSVPNERKKTTLSQSKEVDDYKRSTRRLVVSLTPLSLPVGSTRMVCTVTVILTFCDMPGCFCIRMRRGEKSKKYFRRGWKLNNSKSETVVAGSVVFKRPHTPCTSNSPRDQTWWRDMSLRT
ncbi:hypothetical protein HBI04_148640 [Parastagonospora nodorum]|nr:hypothetical protein HBI03_095450 [Parastagonospora nodorum]KAH4270886.1 hypothetical protein HBI04_148640 [Parastagonospora nodorum]KAH5327846.1 hypothetical protein HBI50_078550 [Parastagonospora nodorum]